MKAFFGIVSVFILGISATGCNPYSEENKARAVQLITEETASACVKEPKIISAADNLACREGGQAVAEELMAFASFSKASRNMFNGDRVIIQVKQKANQRCLAKPQALRLSCQIGVQLGWEAILRLEAAQNTSSSALDSIMTPDRRHEQYARVASNRWKGESRQEAPEAEPADEVTAAGSAVWVR